MFESCDNLAALNEERIRAIRSGIPSTQVNKEYARRKVELINKQSAEFRRIPFFPASTIKPKQLIAIDAMWDDKDPYTLIINESV